MTEKVADGDGGDWSSMKDNIDGDGDCGPKMRINEVERLRKMQLSIAESSSVFPGFRFSPTDGELISYYLKKKLQGSDNCVDIIPEVDFCRHEPWDLPALSIIRSDNEWFFFSARGKKYPNGSQSKRATQSGYWKATGKERNVKSGAVTIGTKRTLVFHMGRAPKGERTEWIMHEYCMSDATQESLVVCRLRRNGDFRLTESSRGGYSPPVDNGHSGTSEHANTHTDGFDEANAIKSTSKESTSSYRPHSVEQNDSVSESDQEPIHESPHGSSSSHKDEDDCFADIINDDIIQLDESSSHCLTFHGLLPKDLNCKQTISQRTFSTQGTAVRRIKLRRQKGRTHRDNPPAPPEAVAANDGHQGPPRKEITGCVFSVLLGKANTLSGSRATRVIIVLLFLVMLFVAWKGQYLTSWSKKFVGKAADYI